MKDLDASMYDQLNKAYREVQEYFRSIGDDQYKQPIIILDYYSEGVHFFPRESEAVAYIEETHTNDWSDEPPSGEDEELVVIKFCGEKPKNRWETSFKDYKPYKEVNGNMIYSKRTLVDFEPEIMINVQI